MTDRRPGLTVPGYEDLVEIGRGGFAIVYRARQRRFDRQVALKVLTTPGLDDVARARFERECLAAGRLSWHPNIVVVYDAGVSDTGLPYLAMEYMEAGSLRDRLSSGGAVEWPEALHHTVQVAGALQTAHDHGLLHRDIKPDNLLVGALGVIKLADFGIAAVTGHATTATGTVTATVAHAAPEVLTGQRANVASEVYSLGSTLFELVSGAAAFVRDTDESIVPIVMRATHDPVPDLRTRGVPGPVATVIEEAMAKDPGQRPGSARELGEALQAVQRAGDLAPTRLPIRGAAPEHATVTVEPPAAPPRPGPDASPQLRTVTRGRRGLIAAAALLVALVVMGLGALALVGNGSDGSQEARDDGRTTRSTEATTATTIAAGDPIVLPDVVGFAESAAVDALRAAGFTNVSVAPGVTGPAGEVSSPGLALGVLAGETFANPGDMLASDTPLIVGVCCPTSGSA